MAQKPNEVSLGKELDWSDEEMETLSTQTSADYVQAQQLWDEAVDPLFQDLLQAEDDEAENPEG